MSDPGVAPPTIPSFAATFLHSLALKAATGAGAYLVGQGILTKDQNVQFVTIATGAVILAGSVLWSWIRTELDTARAKALAAAPPPTVPASSSYPPGR